MREIAIITVILGYIGAMLFAARGLYVYLTL
jgi:hypothetical protein